MIISFLLIISFSAFSSEVDLYNGQTIQINVQNCTPSHYGAVGMALSDVVATRRNSEGSAIHFAQKLTARCLPKICEFRNWWNTFGGPRSTITLLPMNIKLAETSSDKETEEVLKKFIAEGVCAKSQRYVPSM